MPANNAINSDVQKRRFALLLHAGYGERYIYWGVSRLNRRSQHLIQSNACHLRIIGKSRDLHCSRTPD